MKKLSLVVLISLLLALLTQAKITIDTKTRTFRDEYGRARIFHGTNVVVKGPPYIPVQDRFDPQLSLIDEDIQNMIDWGITFVRLGVQWESVETSEQSYNYTYLDEINKLVNKLGNKGIVVLIDAHQDLFSRKTCGNGMPVFYANDLETACPKNTQGIIFKAMGNCVPMADYGFRAEENGLPLIEDCLKNIFIKYYPSPEVSSSFEGLYSNDTIQQRFVDFWDVTSKHLANNEYIIGYDPINEPWPANIYKDFSLFYKQTKFDSDILFPLLVKVHDVIRKNVQDMHYFYEPAQFPDTLPFFGGITASLGFPGTPGGDQYLGNQVLNDHVYCCQAVQDVCLGGEPPLEMKDKCKAFHKYKVQIRSDDAKRYGVPLIWSEFGACSNTEACFNEITSAAEEFDNHLSSWMYWMFKGFGDFTTTGGLVEGMYDQDGNLQNYKMLALSRTFIHAFQGTPLSIFFVNYGLQNGTFIGQFILDSDIKSPTEVFFNEDIYYKEGYKITVMVEDKPLVNLKIDKSQKNYLKFKITINEYSGKTVAVILTPLMQIKENIIATNELELHYLIQDLPEQLVGHNKFSIENFDNQTGELHFEILGSDSSIICSGQFSHMECEALSINSHSIKFNIYKKGWFGKSYLLEAEIPKINGHKVTLTLSKVLKEVEETNNEL